MLFALRRQPMRGVPTNGTLIRTLRQSLALTQEELATIASCDVKTVRKAEQGKRLE
jgi:DNA-binding transcriptional regulator YiaG